MEPKEKLELLQMAIKQLIEEEKGNDAKRSSSHENLIAVCEDGDQTDDNRRLLSKLLSQLESLKEDDRIEQTKPSADTEKIDSAEVDDKSKAANESCGCGLEIGAEEIVKELKKVRRQNFITHCLMSAMIVLTVAWQLSEVSLILKVQEGLCHPLRSLGSLVRGMLQGPGATLEELDKGTSAMRMPIVQASSLPGLKIPEFPRVEFPAFHIDNDEE